MNNPMEEAAVRRARQILGRDYVREARVLRRQAWLLLTIAAGLCVLANVTVFAGLAASGVVRGIVWTCDLVVLVALGGTLLYLWRARRADAQLGLGD